MSVLGRLEDLSVPDILQIISLSRQTGTLHVSAPEETFKVFFSSGFIVGAASPDTPLPQSPQQQTKYAISDAIRRIVARLLRSTEGEFAFSVAESVVNLGLPYDPTRLFPEGGLHPRSLTGKAANIRRAPTPAAPPLLTESSAELTEPFEVGTEEEGGAAPLEELLSSSPVSPAKTDDEMVVVGTRNEEPRTSGHLTVVVEPDPVLRVAVRRALESAGAEVRHYISIAEARPTIQELLADNRFFVTLAGTAAAHEEVSLVQQIKRRNRFLPVVAIHHPESPGEDSLLQLGFDAAIAAPSLDSLQSESVTQLQVLAEQVLHTTDRAFAEWDRLRRGLDSTKDAGLQLYQLADEQRMKHSSAVLRRLLDQLVTQHDTAAVSQIILELAGEYVDRAALFLVGPNSFIGLAGYSASPGGSQLDARVKQMRIPLDVPSVLRTAVDRRTMGRESSPTIENDQVVERLGPPLPTEAIAVPIFREGEITGVLYGDNAEYHGPLGRTDGLEMFLAEAGFALA